MKGQAEATSRKEPRDIGHRARACGRAADISAGMELSSLLHG